MNLFIYKMKLSFILKYEYIFFKYFKYILIFNYSISWFKIGFSMLELVLVILLVRSLNW